MSEVEEVVALLVEEDWPRLLAAVERHPALVRAHNVDGMTLLALCSARPGALDVVKRMLELGADPNARGPLGSTALAAAIVGGSTCGLSTLPILRLLLAAGADPETVADSGMPALHWAIAHNRLEHAEVLLQHGARTDALTADDPPETAEDVARRMYSTVATELLKTFRSSTAG